MLRLPDYRLPVCNRFGFTVVTLASSMHLVVTSRFGADNSYSRGRCSTPRMSPFFFIPFALLSRYPMFSFLPRGTITYILYVSCNQPLTDLLSVTRYLETRPLVTMSKEKPIMGISRSCDSYPLDCMHAIKRRTRNNVFLLPQTLLCQKKIQSESAQTLVYSPHEDGRENSKGVSVAPQNTT